MEKHGKLEVFARRIATILSPIKKALKRKTNKDKKAMKGSDSKKSIADFKACLKKCNIVPGDIVLIHSSTDGLQSLQMKPNEIVDLIMEIFKGATVVFATFPIEPRKPKEVYKYNPNKTMCWTGMLPNAFLQKPGIVRSLTPYNSLAAYGELTNDMMKDNILSETPHGEHSAWYYCYTHHAKILFVGTTSRESNTMAIHMVPDVMKEKWPIKDWYEKRQYQIVDNQKVLEKTLFIQKGFWYRYVNEYKTDKVLKDSGYLKIIKSGETSIEIVNDSFEMLNFLINRCENNQLMYSIPKKYYKKKHL